MGVERVPDYRRDRSRAGNVIAIQRGEQLIFPERATVVIGGDVLSVLAPPGAESRVRELVGSGQPQQGQEDRQEML